MNGYVRSVGELLTTESVKIEATFVIVKVDAPSGSWAACAGCAVGVVTARPPTAITAAHVPAMTRRNRGARWCTWVPASFPAGVPVVGAVPREAFRSCVSVSSMPTPSLRVIVPAGYRQTN